MTATPGSRLRWARRPRSTCARTRPELGPRPDAVLRLEMDEHVGAAHARPDLVLQLVRDGVGLLQRRAVAELHVQVDVAPRASATSAQLVVADHPARPE